jgi:hypothetical protein
MDHWVARNLVFRDSFVCVATVGRPSDITGQVGFVVDKVALGQVYLRVLRYPLPIFIPPIAPQSPSPIIWGWYSRPEVAAVQGT